MKREILMKEHKAVRENVGYYDFTHQLLNVTGPDAGKFLDKMFVNAISKLGLGQATYTTMLNEEGHIIDDVIVFYVEEERYVVSTLYIKEMIEWFDKHKTNEDVTYEDITSKLTMFAVQGPKSKDLINSLVDDNIDDLQFFTIEDNTVGDLDIEVARAGFTGELGYEIYVPTEKKDLLEKELVNCGKKFNLMNITSDVIINSLPGEKGYVLMSDLKGCNPMEVGYGWTIDWNSDFIGKDALLRAKKEGIKRDLVGFTVEMEDAGVEAGNELLIDGECVGRVTKYTYGFTVEKGIGYALINTERAKIGDKVKIKTSSGEIDASLCERMFYDKSNSRVRA
ncbi:aminomethyltransferase family protein [Peptoniphilus catoniae]|uniref:aminomethyltransferase family protein n=1 Tax=Peptoniphilus catoniae TaxID=1660341 RepID=UPI0010FF1FF7|nr:aminomethyltransferase family protein [Peptoniphilus catoniae]